MRPVVVRRHHNTVRVYVLGQRLHHGTTGLVLCLIFLPRRSRLAVLGAALIAHDRRDWAVWLKRETIPTESELSTHAQVHHTRTTRP